MIHNYYKAFLFWFWTVAKCIHSFLVLRCLLYKWSLCVSMSSLTPFFVSLMEEKKKQYCFVIKLKG